MNTLIIPCAGRSSRYPNLRPKWLLTHPDGDLMLKKVINALKFTHLDRIIITIIKEQCEKFEADLIIKQSLGDDIEICILDDYTSSQSETVYATIEKMKINGSFIAKDSDSCVNIDIEKFTNFLVGADLRKHPEVTNVPSKSFLILNDQNIIVDIIEKSVCSNFINLGVYGFSSAEAFKKAYSKLKDISEEQQGEFWLSHIVSYLIGEGDFFDYYESDHFDDWGTLYEWLNMRRKHKCYFVDIDGVVFKNKGEFGSINWNTLDEPLKGNIGVLRKIVEDGGQIIFCTARPENQREKLEKSLTKHGLEWHKIVMGCLHSQRVLINDYAASNPYPSSLAISLQRDDDNLNSFLNDL
jgi:NDP-sugar pyrophosphorylase family protein